MDDDDDFDLNDEQPNSNLEKAVARLKKENEKLKAENDKRYEEGRKDTLKQIETEQQVTSWATEKFDNPALGQTFLNQRDLKPEDITEANLLEFGKKLKFEPKAAPEGEAEGEKPPENPPPDPFHRTGTAVGGAQTITHEQYRAMVTNPATHLQAIQARQAGLVQDPGKGA